MAEPRDRQFFALSSAVVKEGLAFIERRLAAKRVIQSYDNWPVITWSQGMPDFSFTCANPPIDYTDAFNSLWSMVAMFVGGTDTQERFDFDKHQPYQELKRYIRSEPHFASHVFPPDLHEDMCDSAIRVFLQRSIDRYIHITGATSFDSDRFLEIYLPLEAGLLLEELPIEIHTPILLVSFPSDSYDLEDAISITRMSEPMQLARARRDHDTHNVDENLLQQASHSLVLRNYVLPNSDYRLRPWGYGASPAVFETIDTFFACLRIVTSIETGYAQILFVPIGWAHSYTASLPPLEGLTTRKYPPNFWPVSAFYGNEFSKISDHQIESVLDLFGALTLIQNTGQGSRVRLAIKRLNSCYMREDEQDTILDATIGLEILLSDGDTQEVTHKLALRLAALSTLVPGYEQQAATIFRNVKSTIYPFRSAVVHGNEKKASKTREIKVATGEAIAAVKLAVEYLGMAVRAVVTHPEYLAPATIDERLLLGQVPRP
jgi:hypothetical protein